MVQNRRATAGRFEHFLTDATQHTFRLGALRAVVQHLQIWTTVETRQGRQAAHGTHKACATILGAWRVSDARKTLTASMASGTDDFSLVAQRLDRVQARSAAGREIAKDHAHRC